MQQRGPEHKRALEQASRHLARADGEARSAQMLLERSFERDADEEQALTRAVAGARTFLGDAIETIRARTWSQM